MTGRATRRYMYGLTALCQILTSDLLWKQRFRDEKLIPTRYTTGESRCRVTDVANALGTLWHLFSTSALLVTDVMTFAGYGRGTSPHRSTDISGTETIVR
jgi:hypothetical protein